MTYETMHLYKVYHKWQSHDKSYDNWIIGKPQTYTRMSMMHVDDKNVSRIIWRPYNDNSRHKNIEKGRHFQWINTDLRDTIQFVWQKFQNHLCLFPNVGLYHWFKDLRPFAEKYTKANLSNLFPKEFGLIKKPFNWHTVTAYLVSYLCVYAYARSYTTIVNTILNIIYIYYLNLQINSHLHQWFNKANFLNLQPKFGLFN